ncbi:MAG: precorrin-8X methylmutase [Spirochaetales bacterium]|nr:precorrin-8X methylmutase [Spirochaetales bacterium]
MEYVKTPEGIYKKSFAIVEEGLTGLDVTPSVREVIKRAAHATADIEFGRNLAVTDEAVRAGVEALRKGTPLVTDVTMVQAGIRKAPLERFGIELHCFLYDEDVAVNAKEKGTTKSAAAMEKAATLLPEAVYVIGNAPTAVFTLCELFDKGLINPALVVGIPIGFVGAAECKEELLARKIPCITNHGPKGGSPVAAAITNALIFLAQKEEDSPL